MALIFYTYVHRVLVWDLALVLIPHAIDSESYFRLFLLYRYSYKFCWNNHNTYMSINLKILFCILLVICC